MPYDDDLKNVSDDDHKMHDLAKEEEPPIGDRVNPLQVLRERSLRSCCTKVLEAQRSRTEEDSETHGTQALQE